MSDSGERKQSVPPAGPAQSAASEPLPAQPAVCADGAPGVRIRVNGADRIVHRHRCLLDALDEAGVYVPRFCYHPALSPAGNCRMCCVTLIDPKTGRLTSSLNLATMQEEPKLFMACTTPLADGMVVETENDAVRRGRALVMEFLLINHPLDCPVCDKAGECFLQDYAFLHGRDRSRFSERKVEKAPRDLGPGLKLWTDRCIECTRCVRFLEEVAGTCELAVTQRGDRCEIAAAPGREVAGPMTCNVVDICPVGALIAPDFLYAARAWDLSKTPSLCPTCARGCNVSVEWLLPQFEDVARSAIKRFVPRHNPCVNGHWMCDLGRYSYRHVGDPARLADPTVDGEKVSLNRACEAAGARLAEIAKDAPGSVAGIASAWQTVEEIWLLARLVRDELRGGRMGLMAAADAREAVLPGFRISGDRNPNRAGAAIVLGETTAQRGLAAVIEAIHRGEIRAAYLAGGIPGFEPAPELLDALAKLRFLVVQDILPSALTKRANVVLPGAAFAEKDGVFVNEDGRCQRLSRAFDPPGRAHEDILILQRVIRAVAGRGRLSGAGEILAQIAKVHGEFAGMTIEGIGTAGVPLRARPEEKGR